MHLILVINKYTRVVGTASSSIGAFGVKSYSQKNLNYNNKPLDNYNQPSNQEDQYHKPVFDDYVDKLRDMKNSYEDINEYKPKYSEGPYRDYDRGQSRGNISGKILFWLFFTKKTGNKISYRRRSKEIAEL
jgi:hypothetical protein